MREIKILEVVFDMYYVVLLLLVTIIEKKLSLEMIKRTEAILPFR